MAWVSPLGYSLKCVRKVTDVVDQHMLIPRLSDVLLGVCDALGGTSQSLSL